MMMKEEIKLNFIYDVGNYHKEIIIPVIPKNVSYAHNSNIATQQIIGRMTPINRFTRGGDETYNFSVEIHNDMLTIEGKQKLTELVQDIKMLSYPVNKQGEIVYPKIYFNLGELNGFCIVDTNINWKKPIINGHYALVEITFNLRMVRKIQAPTITYIKAEGEVSLDNKIYTGYTDEQFKQMQDRLKQRDYDTSIEDFIIGGDDNNSKTIKTEAAIERIDNQKERLNYLYGAIITQAKESESRVKWVEKNLGWIESIKTGKNIIQDNRNVMKDIKQIRTFFKNLEKHKKEYHKHSDLTTEQIDTVFEQIKSILEDIIETREEVVGYAARS